VLVAYLLEVRRRDSGGGRGSGAAPWSSNGR
jgi:hypothetical protein